MHIIPHFPPLVSRIFNGKVFAPAAVPSARMNVACVEVLSIPVLPASKSLLIYVASIENWHWQHFHVGNISIFPRLRPPMLMGEPFAKCRLRGACLSLRITASFSRQAGRARCPHRAALPAICAQSAIFRSNAQNRGQTAAEYEGWRRDGGRAERSSWGQAGN